MNKFRNFEEHSISDNVSDWNLTQEELDNFKKYEVLDVDNYESASSKENWMKDCYLKHSLKSYSELGSEEKAKCDTVIKSIMESEHTRIENGEDRDVYYIAMDEVHSRYDTYYNKKQEAREKYLLEKCGKSKIKHWFYFGRKWYKDTDGVQRYHTSMYEHLRYKAFLKYIKNIEKKGLEIKRPYYYGGSSRSYLYNCTPDYYGSIWKRIKQFFDFHFSYQYRTCWFDPIDLESYILISLTIKGLGQFVHGNTTSSKRIGHLCWKLRKEIIKANDYEDIKDDIADIETSKKFGFPEKFSENLISLDKDAYLDHGYSINDIKAGIPLSIVLKPSIVEKLIDKTSCKSEREVRQAILDKMDEIDEFRKPFYTDYTQITKHEELLQKAYGYLGMKLPKLWD